MAVAVLVTTFRWTSWTPRVFYTQIFLAAVSILAQTSVHRDSALIWRSFIITRVRYTQKYYKRCSKLHLKLTHLLSDFEQVLSSEPMVDADWVSSLSLDFSPNTMLMWE